MFIITTRKQFSESARRLANAFTVKSAVDMVARSLRNTQRHALAESLELAFVGKFNDERMGLPQANDILATALSGEDQNVTSSKIKKNKSIGSTLTESDSNRVQNYADDIKAIAFTLGNQVDFIESIKKSFEFAAERHGIEEQRSLPEAESAENTSQHILGYLLYALRHDNVISLETDGMTSFSATSYGTREYSRLFTISFASFTFSMQFEWKENEYETDELFITCHINDLDVDSYLLDKDADGNFSFDNFNTFMETIHISEFVQNELAGDFVDVNLKGNECLLPVAEYLANL